MVNALRWMLVVGLLLCAGGTRAQVDTAVAEDLLRKSGYWEQMTSIAPQIRTGLFDAMERSNAVASEAERERIVRIIEAAYAPARLRAVSAGVVAERLDAAHVAALQRWYGSKRGQFIARLEEQASSAGGDPQSTLQAGTAQLGREPPERRKLLGELVAATRMAEVLVRIAVNTSLAVQRGTEESMPSGPRTTAAELRSALDAERAQMLKGFGVIALAEFARTYASLPTGDLRAYVEFYRSPAGSAYGDASSEALDAALSDAAQEMGRQLQGARDQSHT